MTSAPAAPKAFAAWWSEMQRWSVSSFMELDWQWPPEVIRPLADALERRDVVVDRTSTPNPPLVTLHFTGEMHHRDRSGTKSVKGRLWWAKPGEVIYSKIDVRNGAIGVIPDELGPVAVTSEYPVYHVKADVADASYIKLLFRTNYFRRRINSLISGASGRKRVQPGDLEALSVPLPLLREQRAIVAAFERAKSTAAALRAKADELDAAVEADFLKALGLTPPVARTLPKVLAVQWSDAERWSVLFHQIAAIAVDLDSGKYTPQPLGELLTLVQYGSSQKADRSGRGTPIIRMNNIVDGVFDLSDLKFVQLSKAETESLLLERDDILINRTNSKELVGKCAVFEAEGAFVFASYLIRLRADGDRADPAFLAYVINGSIGRGQIDQVSRQIGGQANINTEEIRALRIPCPGPDVQQSLMKPVLAARTRAASLREQATHAERAAFDHAERLILGNKSAALGDNDRIGSVQSQEGRAV